MGVPAGVGEFPYFVSLCQAATGAAFCGGSHDVGGLRSSFRGATMVGAGPILDGQDSCQGDSGGPLVITSTDHDIQIGDVSWATAARCRTSPASTASCTRARWPRSSTGRYPGRRTICSPLSPAFAAVAGTTYRVRV